MEFVVEHKQIILFKVRMQCLILNLFLLKLLSTLSAYICIIFFTIFFVVISKLKLP